MAPIRQLGVVIASKLQHNGDKITRLQSSVINPTTFTYIVQVHVAYIEAKVKAKIINFFPRGLSSMSKYQIPIICIAYGDN